MRCEYEEFFNPDLTSIRSLMGKVVNSRMGKIKERKAWILKILLNCRGICKDIFVA